MGGDLQMPLQRNFDIAACNRVLLRKLRLGHVIHLLFYKLSMYSGGCSLIIGPRICSKLEVWLQVDAVKLFVEAKIALEIAYRGAYETHQPHMKLRSFCLANS